MSAHNCLGESAIQKHPALSSSKAVATFPNISRMSNINPVRHSSRRLTGGSFPPSHSAPVKQIASSYALAITGDSCRLTVELPEGAFSALRSSPEVFAKEMRLAAAVKWYEIGMISQSKAAEIADVSRYEFLEALSRYKVSPFQVTPSELAEELAGD